MVKLEVLVTAHLDELFLNITNSPTLIIAVCPELPLDLISSGQCVCPVHDYNDLLLACAFLGNKRFQSVTGAFGHKSSRDGDVSQIPAN